MNGVTLLALTALSMSACGGSPDAGGPDLTDINRVSEALELDGMRFHDTCAKKTATECSSCLARARRVQNSCREACNLQARVSGNFAFNCASSCTETSPSELCEYACDAPTEKAQCEQRKFEFELLVESDPAVKDACEAAVRRDDGCRESNIEDDCELYGRVESADTLPTYACLTELACGEQLEQCYDQLPKSRLTSELETACETVVDPKLVERLDLQGRWITPLLQSNALLCADRYCETEDYQQCLWAWSNAVLGN